MPDSIDQERLDLVARHVRQRRLAMRLSIEDAAESVRMSPVTWGRVEKALPVRSLTYAAVERALHWTAGSVEALMTDGTRPTVDVELRDHAVAHDEISVERSTDAIEELIRQVWASQKMPEDRKADLVRVIRRAEADVRAAQDEVRRWDASA